MAKQFDTLGPAHLAFIARQRIFFTATATADSRVNISPREIAALRIAGANTAYYLDRTGSGMETAAHLCADGRMTIMLCSFDGPPLIMRLYGRGESLFRESAAFERCLADHYGGDAPLGTRQIVRLAIDLVQTSCGYGVPLFDYTGERTTMESWHADKGEDGLKRYWSEQNMQSIDGLPTGFADP